MDAIMVRVTQVKYLHDYELWLQFDDGSSGTIDLNAHLNGPMFEPLKNIAVFKQVVIDPELDTIVWPNGADIAPEFLYEHVNGQ